MKPSDFGFREEELRLLETALLKEQGRSEQLAQELEATRTRLASLRDRQGLRELEQKRLDSLKLRCSELDLELLEERSRNRAESTRTREQLSLLERLLADERAMRIQADTLAADLGRKLAALESAQAAPVLVPDRGELEELRAELARHREAIAAAATAAQLERERRETDRKNLVAAREQLFTAQAELKALRDLRGELGGEP